MMPVVYGVCLFVMGCMAVVELFLFVNLPQHVIRWLGPAHRRHAIRVLEALAVLPAPLLGSRAKAVVLTELARMYTAENRYQDSIRCYYALLAIPVTGYLRAEYTRRLADCLDHVGRLDEASDLRQRELERTTPATALHMLAQARMLKKEERHDEAYRMLEEAMGHVSEASARAPFLTELMMCAYHRGMIAESAAFAEQALAVVDSDVLRRVCHRMAGLTCENLGRLQEAAVHYREHLALSESEPPEKKAEALTSLASLVIKEGALREGIALLEKALLMGEVRSTRMLLSDAFRHLGNFEEAARHLELSLQAPARPDQRREVFSRGLLDLNRCWVECWADRTEQARTYFERAKPALQRNDKTNLYLEATDVWLMALAGRDARLSGDAHGALLEVLQEQANIVLRHAASFRDDRTCRSNVDFILGRTFSAVGDHWWARERWLSYLSSNPTAMTVPIAQYFLGEALQSLGESEAARRAFQSAAASGSETYFVELARQRISSC